MMRSTVKKKIRIFSFLPLLIIMLSGIGGGLAFWKNESNLRLAEQQHKEWKDYGGQPDHSKYVELKHITKANVKPAIAFKYSTNDNLAYNFNPFIVDGVMYVLARNIHCDLL